jgi:hypothetical protein
METRETPFPVYVSRKTCEISPFEKIYIVIFWIKEFQAWENNVQ